MKLVYFNELGAWSALGYNAVVIILDYSYIDTKGNSIVLYDSLESSFNIGQINSLVWSGRGSSYPNPSKPKPNNHIKTKDAYGLVRCGIYQFRYSKVAHKWKHKGLIINENKRVPTAYPNPNQDGEYFATNIHVHKGASFYWRGSAGCLTIHPEDFDSFCSVFTEDETGYLYVYRKNSNLERIIL